MEKIKVLRDFHPFIDREKVFRQLNCYPDSPVYEEMEESFDEIKDEMLKLCKPVGVLSLGRIPSGYFHGYSKRGTETDKWRRIVGAGTVKRIYVPSDQNQQSDLSDYG